MSSAWKLPKLSLLLLLAGALAGCRVQSTPIVKPTEAPIIMQAILTNPEAGESLEPNQNVSVTGTVQGNCPATVVVRLLNHLGEIVNESNPQTSTEKQACTWETNLLNPLADGIHGWIVVVLTSALDSSLWSSDAIPVISGNPQSGPFVTITNPEPYQTIASETMTISGRGGALFENHLVVQVEDEQGTILASAPVTLDAQEMGEEGEWHIMLSIPVSGDKPGRIVAFANSPKDGSLLTNFAIPILFSSPSP